MEDAGPGERRQIHILAFQVGHASAMPKDGPLSTWLADRNKRELRRVPRRDLEEVRFDVLPLEPRQDFCAEGIVGDRAQKSRLDAQARQGHQGGGRWTTALLMEVHKFNFLILMGIVRYRAEIVHTSLTQTHNTDSFKAFHGPVAPFPLAGLPSKFCELLFNDNNVSIYLFFIRG